jgi:hypothetical protein
MVVPDGGIGRIPETRGVEWIMKNLQDSALLANQSNGIPLVSRDPDVLPTVKDNAVTALQDRMGNDDVAQAERIGR